VLIEGNSLQFCHKNIKMKRERDENETQQDKTTINDDEITQPPTKKQKTRSDSHCEFVSSQDIHHVLNGITPTVDDNDNTPVNTIIDEFMEEAFAMAKYMSEPTVNISQEHSKVLALYNKLLLDKNGEIHNSVCEEYELTNIKKKGLEIFTQQVEIANTVNDIYMNDGGTNIATEIVEPDYILHIPEAIKREGLDLEEVQNYRDNIDDYDSYWIDDGILDYKFWRNLYDEVEDEQDFVLSLDEIEEIERPIYIFESLPIEEYPILHQLDWNNITNDIVPYMQLVQLLVEIRPLSLKEIDNLGETEFTIHYIPDKIYYQYFNLLQIMTRELTKIKGTTPHNHFKTICNPICRAILDQFAIYSVDPPEVNDDSDNESDDESVESVDSSYSDVEEEEEQEREWTDDDGEYDSAFEWNSRNTDRIDYTIEDEQQEEYLIQRPSRVKVTRPVNADYKSIVDRWTHGLSEDSILKEQWIDTYFDDTGLIADSHPKDVPDTIDVKEQDPEDPSLTIDFLRIRRQAASIEETESSVVEQLFVLRDFIDSVIGEAIAAKKEQNSNEITADDIGAALATYEYNSRDGRLLHTKLGETMYENFPTSSIHPFDRTYYRLNNEKENCVVQTQSGERKVIEYAVYSEFPDKFGFIDSDSDSDESDSFCDSDEEFHSRQYGYGCDDPIDLSFTCEPVEVSSYSLGDDLLEHCAQLYNDESEYESSKIFNPYIIKWNGSVIVVNKALIQIRSPTLFEHLKQLESNHLVFDDTIVKNLNPEALYAFIQFLISGNRACVSDLPENQSKIVETIMGTFTISTENEKVVWNGGFVLSLPITTLIGKEKNDYSDIAITYSDKDDNKSTTLYLQKDILAARSKYFETMFQSRLTESTLSEIDLSDIAPSFLSFYSIIHFIYSDELISNVQKHITILIDCIHVADFFQVDQRMRELCELQLARKLSVSNVVQIMHVTGLYSTAQLYENCEVFIMDHLDEVLEMNDSIQEQEDNIKLSEFEIDYFDLITENASIESVVSQLEEAVRLLGHTDTMNVCMNERLRKYWINHYMLFILRNRYAIASECPEDLTKLTQMPSLDQTYGNMLESIDAMIPNYWTEQKTFHGFE
jgi:hypothetical protein